MLINHKLWAKKIESSSKEEHTFHGCKVYNHIVNLDSNECYQASKCQNGQCFNMDGTYRCACNPGYRLTGDEKTCVGKHSYLLFLDCSSNMFLLWSYA